MGSSAENQFHGNNNMAEQDQESFSYAIQLVNFSVLPMSLHAAIQLEIFEIIAKAGPDAKLSPKEMAAQLPTKNPEAPSMLDPILRVLAGHCIVGCSVADDEQGNPQRLYCLTPVSKFFVRNEDGVSLGPFMSLLQDKVFLDSWSQLKEAILEGGIPFDSGDGHASCNCLVSCIFMQLPKQLLYHIGKGRVVPSWADPDPFPSDRVHGTNLFEYPSREPRFNQVFNTAMINHTTIVVKKILESYKGFEQLNQVVDVGGGRGVNLSMITSKYPSIKGINFDLPHVIEHAPAYSGNLWDTYPIYILCYSE